MESARFSTTSWSLIVQAAQTAESSSEALSRLCQAYWPPIYAYIRRNGYDPDEARDLTQAFFALMLEKKYLGDADPARGRFRSFLLTAVKRFLGKEKARARTLKRGGGQVVLSIDLAETEAWYLPVAASGETPEAVYERRWALSLLDRAMTKLRVRFEASGRSEDFQTLVGFLNGNAESQYEDTAVKIGVSAGALRTQVHRLRRQYREVLRAEIAETVTTEAEIDEEIRFLLGKLSP